MYRGNAGGESQPNFNKKKDFENSVMEFFKDEHADVNEFDVVPAYEDPTERMDFSHGLDISKIKVSH